MPNFRSLQLGAILPYKNYQPGDTIIEYGTFTGVSQNQYGNLYNFELVDGRDKVTLPKCGKLERMYQDGDLKVGYRYQVKYLGKEVLEKGAYKGKEFNNLEVLEDIDYIPSNVVPQPPKNASSGLTQDVESDDLLA